MADPEFHRFGERLQALAGLAGEGRLQEFIVGVRRLAGELPVPLSFAETCVLEKLLLDFAILATQALTSIGVAVAELDRAASATDAFRKWARSLPSAPIVLDLDSTRTSGPLRRVLHMMQQDYRKPLKIADLAGAVGWSEPYLCDKFRRRFGITAHQCLTRIRMARAASLLRHGTKPEAVALLVGYRSPSRFYKTFREAAGCTPTEYARRTKSA